MIDPIKAFGDVGIKDVLRLLTDGVEDGGDGVMASATRSESVTVGLKSCLPFWLQS
jgi:hypothetical protein